MCLKGEKMEKQVCSGNKPNPSSLFTDKWGSLFPCVSACLDLCIPHNASLHPELIAYVTWQQMAAVAMAL